MTFRFLRRCWKIQGIYKYQQELAYYANFYTARVAKTKEKRRSLSAYLVDKVKSKLCESRDYEADLLCRSMSQEDWFQKGLHSTYHDAPFTVQFPQLRFVNFVNLLLQKLFKISYTLYIYRTSELSGFGISISR